MCIVSHASSPEQNVFGDLLMDMDMQFSVDTVNPQSIHSGEGNFLRAGHYREVARLYALDQPSNVNVNMALGVELLGIIRDTPLVAPQFFGFGDRSAPECFANFHWKSGHLMHARRMLARQCECSIGLSGAIILDQEKEDPGRLVLGHVAQRALRYLQRFGRTHVARASDLSAREARKNT